ncbi:MAG: hypothetical protein ABIF10_02555 [Candidatus Woesearchaeota archaeon]
MFKELMLGLTLAVPGNFAYQAVETPVAQAETLEQRANTLLKKAQTLSAEQKFYEASTTCADALDIMLRKGNFQLEPIETAWNCFDRNFYSGLDKDIVKNIDNNQHLKELSLLYSSYKKTRNQYMKSNPPALRDKYMGRPGIFDIHVIKDGYYPYLLLGLTKEANTGNHDYDRVLSNLQLTAKDSIKDLGLEASDNLTTLVGLMPCLERYPGWKKEYLKFATRGLENDLVMFVLWLPLTGINKALNQFYSLQFNYLTRAVPLDMLGEAGKEVEAWQKAAKKYKETLDRLKQ